MHIKVELLIVERYPTLTNSYIFSNMDNVYRQEFISKKFKKAIRDAGLPDELHFHSLRHSFASILVQSGVSLYVVKELLGHASISTAQYIHT